MIFLAVTNCHVTHFIGICCQVPKKSEENQNARDDLENKRHKCPIIIITQRLVNVSIVLDPVNSRQQLFEILLVSK